MILDVRKFLDAFGGRLAVRTRVKNETGEKLSEGQVEKWCERNSIPSDHLITLQTIGAQMKPPVILTDFLEPKTH